MVLNLMILARELAQVAGIAVVAVVAAWIWARRGASPALVVMTCGVLAALLYIAGYGVWARPDDERALKDILMLGFIAELPLALLGCWIASGRSEGRLGPRWLLAAALGFVVGATPVFYFVATVGILVLLGEGRSL
jgi:hypothetical protein